ncbi:MBL fold metallo-hydrolase [Methylobacterium sp. CM6244]
MAGMQVPASPEVLESIWKHRSPRLAPDRHTVAQTLESNRFELEARNFRVVDLGQTDTDDTTGLHVPPLDLVVSGDAVYSEVHPLLVESDKADRKAWRAALNRIAALNPKTINVGHGPLTPDDSPTYLVATWLYIGDFDWVSGRTTTARQLYDALIALNPDRVNLGSLWGSAHVAEGEV